MNSALPPPHDLLLDKEEGNRIIQQSERDNIQQQTDSDIRAYPDDDDSVKIQLLKEPRFNDQNITQNINLPFESCEIILSMSEEKVGGNVGGNVGGKVNKQRETDGLAIAMEESEFKLGLLLGSDPNPNPEQRLESVSGVICQTSSAKLLNPIVAKPDKVIDDQDISCPSEKRNSVELRLSQVVNSKTRKSLTPVSTVTPVILNTVPSHLPYLEPDSPIEGMFNDFGMSFRDPLFNPVRDSHIDKTAVQVEKSAINDSSLTPPLISSWLSPAAVVEEPKFLIYLPSGESFELASSKRNNDFHELFPSLSKKDRLVNGKNLFPPPLTDLLDFTCAWLAEILLHGRMYITNHNVCFHTKVIWTYTAVIPLKEVTLVEKKAVGGLFDNAMEITTTGDKKYFFTSFLNRNTAFDLISKLKEGYDDNFIDIKPEEIPQKRKVSTKGSDGEVSRRSRSLGSSEILKVVHLESIDTANREKIGLTEIFSPNQISAEFLSESRNDSFSKIPEATNLTTKSLTPSPQSLKNMIVHQKHIVTPPTMSELKEAPARVSHYTPLVTKTVPYICSCGSQHESSKKCLDANVKLSVKEAWQYLYSYESLHMFFCFKLWKKLGFTELRGSDWLPDTANLDDKAIYNTKTAASPCTFEQLKVGYKRRIEYVRPIANPVGAKVSNVIITERVFAISDRHICLDTSSITPGAPSGDAFKVNTRFCILYHDDHSSRLLTSVSIEYLKSTWLKMVLEQVVPKEVREYQTSMVKELELYIENGGTPSSATAVLEKDLSLKEKNEEVVSPTVQAHPLPGQWGFTPGCQKALVLMFGGYRSSWMVSFAINLGNALGKLESSDFITG